MNEQIKVMVEDFVEELFSATGYDFAGSESFETRAAKFAESIVNSCADFVEQDQGSGDVLASRLKEHFVVI